MNSDLKYIHEPLFYLINTISYNEASYIHEVLAISMLSNFKVICLII